MNMHTGTSPAKFHFPFLALLAFLLALANAGCDKSAPPKTPPALTAPALAGPADTILRLHWLGKKRLSTETNAAGFMKIWNQPESARLEAQTLDKLAAAPWRILTNAEPAKPGTGDTNAMSASASTPSTNSVLLRPLLDDLVQEETYWEISQATNQPGEIALAIRLSPERHRVWETNLAAVLASLPEPGTPGSRLGTLKKHVELRRAGAWTLVSLNLNPNPNPAAPVPDANLLTRWASLIQRDGHPYAAPATNYWLTGDVDIAGLFRTFSLSWTLPTNTPRISFTVIGDGENVRTRGELNFAEPLNLKLEPWNIPTNLVHDPLSGFMAIRGSRPLLLDLGWDETRFDRAPNQAFFWAQTGTAPLHFFAFPSAVASNQISLLGDYLLTNINSKMVPVQGAQIGLFVREPDSQRVRWRGLPILSPNLDWFQNGGNPFITGGLFGNRVTNRPAPDALLKQFHGESNLLLYDWELSNVSEYRLIQASQFGRFIFGRPRLSMTNNLGLQWLVAISPNLGESRSSIRLVDQNHLGFTRSSSLGLTAIEIHLLVDWFESPDFPKGLFTFSERRNTDAEALPPPN